MKTDYTVLTEKARDIREYMEDIVLATNIDSKVNIDVQLNHMSGGAYITVRQVENGNVINGFNLIYSKDYDEGNHVLKMMDTNGAGSFTALDFNRIEFFEVVTVIAKSLKFLERRLDRAMEEYK